MKAKRYRPSLSLTAMDKLRRIQDRHRWKDRTWRVDAVAMERVLDHYLKHARIR